MKVLIKNENLILYRNEYGGLELALDKYRSFHDYA